MATPRKPLPTAARLAVGEALEAAQTAAALDPPGAARPDCERRE